MDPPQSLREVVRAHEGGWRLRVGLDGVLELLRRMLWVLVMLIAVIPFALGLAVGLMLLLVPDPSGDREPAIVLTVVLTGPLGLFCVYWAVRLAVVAIRSATAYYQIDLDPAATPTRIVLSGWLHRSTIETANLTDVVVRQRESGLDVVLRTSGKTLVCKVNPLTPVDPHALTGWLSEVLALSTVPVHHHDANGRSLFDTNDVEQ